MTRNASVIAVTSGKGGVGKTHISANLGLLLTEQGKRTCVIDADHGLANINLILGLPAPNPDSQIFHPEYDISQAMIQTDQGMDVLPSASGLSKKISDTPPSKEQIKHLINRLKPLYDVIIIDTSAGINASVKNYLALADQVLLVINSEPTSLTDGFGLVRKMKNVQQSYNVIINRAVNAAAATSIYKRFAGAVRKYIGVQINAIGYISEDSFMSAAVLTQKAVVEYSSGCQASQCLKRIARTVSRKLAEEIKEPQVVHPFNNKKENVTKEIPSSPEFIKTDATQDPFEQWLYQMPMFLDATKFTPKSISSRHDALVKELEKLIEKDKDLLSKLEEMVVNNGMKNSQSIINQETIEQRLANTRFVEEPPAYNIEDAASRRNSGVAKAFSIISRLK